MKKRLNKNTIAAIILGALLTTTLVLPAIAATAPLVTKTISAKFGVSILLDDVPFTPKDAKGNVVPAMIIDGTTYLPVRALAEATGNTVRWDGENNAVRIYTPGNGEWTAVDKDFVAAMRTGAGRWDYKLDYTHFDYTTDAENLKENSGQTYQNGFIYTGEHVFSLAQANILMQTEQQYSTIQFQISVIDAAATAPAVVMVISDADTDIVYERVELSGGTQQIEADISGAKKISIAFEGNRGDMNAESRQITIGDMKLR